MNFDILMHHDNDRQRINRHRPAVMKSLKETLQTHKESSDEQAYLQVATYKRAIEELGMLTEFKNNNLEMHLGMLKVPIVKASFDIIANTAYAIALQAGEKPDWIIDPVSMRIVSGDLEGKLGMDELRHLAAKALDNIDEIDEKRRPTIVRNEIRYPEYSVKRHMLEEYEVKSPVLWLDTHMLFIGRPLKQSIILSVLDRTLDEVFDIALFNGLEIKVTDEGPSYKKSKSAVLATDCLDKQEALPQSE